MELSERWIRTFEAEGFTNVYEWQDPADTVYEEHSHTGKVALFVTDGSATFTIAGEAKELQAGQRFDVPPGLTHSALIGPEGWIVIVAEEIAGDA